MPEFKHIVRMAGKDLSGEKKVQLALTDIKGVSFAYARAAALVAGIDPSMKLGDLTKDQVEQLESILKNPSQFGFPSWMLNRRKDYDTGKDIHLIGPDFDMAVRSDIGRERRIRSRRGIRHELGLPVRGQRTRTTGRKGLTVGVKRKETRMREEAAKPSKAKKEKAEAAPAEKAEAKAPEKAGAKKA
ncbi:MAG: 30S ribosomal protein S13 [Candidatus Hadarchaeum sp.]